MKLVYKRALLPPPHPPIASLAHALDGLDDPLGY